RAPLLTKVIGVTNCHALVAGGWQMPNFFVYYITKLKAENSELKSKVAKLSCDFEKIKSKGIITDLLEHLPISSLAEKKTVSVSTEMENSNDTPEPIDLQTEDVSVSDISDNTSNSGVSLSLVDNTSEQIVSRNEESNTSSHSVSASSKSDIYQDSVTPTSPISAETISLEEKEENEFLNLRYKEQVSKEIMERIREKKLRDQNLSSDRGVASLQGNNTSSETSYENQNLESSIISQSISNSYELSSDRGVPSLQGNNNSSNQSNLSCDLKNVILETNPKDSTEVSGGETISQVYDPLNLNISEISSESKSPTNLSPNQRHKVLCSAKISYNQKVERDLRLELFICIKDNNHKISKVFDIQISEFSLETILSGSSKVTSQNIVDLFRVAMKIRQKETSAKASIDDQSARTIVYNEIKSLLPDITDAQSAISSEIKVIGVTNYYVHMSDLSSSNDSSAELARLKLPEIEVSEEAKKTLPETEATYTEETGLDPWMDSKLSESFEEKTLFVPRVNVQSTPSK
ncbi:11347_t:CDS:2, partial [Diversispora eburnea]